MAKGNFNCSTHSTSHCFLYRQQKGHLDGREVLAVSLTELGPCSGAAVAVVII